MQDTICPNTVFVDVSWEVKQLILFRSLDFVPLVLWAFVPT